MDSDNPLPRLAKENSPQRKPKMDAEHDLSQVLQSAVNLQGMVITDRKDHHERTFVKSRDQRPRMENENNVDPTPWTVLASQRIVMDLDEAFRKLGEKDYLNKCDYVLPGKKICVHGT
jgi:hypothetical protein